MNLIALGINHKTAELGVRERVAFSADQAVEALCQGLKQLPVDEIIILSTCNRTEVYVAPSFEMKLDVFAGEIIGWMARYHKLSSQDLSKASYQFESELAIKHIIKVAAGLDSMVLGEPQIFGQLKSAYAVAIEAGTVGPQLRGLFPKIFNVAKKVRSDTAIGENPVSVAYAAVDLANRIFQNLSDCSVLLIGAGDTIELVAQHLAEGGINKIVIANRTLGRARELGKKFSAKAILLSEIPDYLSGSDIVITSTGSQLPILGKGAVEQALRSRKRRPILMIDIAVPRDIEPQVGDLSDIYLYSVDDLSEIVEANIKNRRDEVSKADEIIAVGTEKLLRQMRALTSVDTVKEYRQMAQSIQDNELIKAQKNISRGDDPELVLSKLARSLTNKLIHIPTARLKQASEDGRTDVIANARVFLGLDEISIQEEIEEGEVEKKPVDTEIDSPGNIPRTLQ